MRNNPCRTAVILNGPPGCGKDTIAEAMVERGFTHHMMKEALYAVTADFFNIDRTVFRELARNRVLKEVPTPLLKASGQVFSPRGALIYTSETIYKPRFGRDYFGRLTSLDCARREIPRVVLSDGGFAEEIKPFLELYDYVFIFRLQRDGFTFEGDSRNYLYGFENTFEIELREHEVEEAVDEIISCIEGTVIDEMNTA